MKKFQSTAAILASLMMFSAPGCGDAGSPPAPVDACGGCPDGHYCVAGLNVCEASNSSDQTTPTDNGAEDPRPGREDRPNPTRPEENNDDDDDTPADVTFPNDEPDNHPDDPVSPPQEERVEDDDACEEVRLVLKPTTGSIPRVMLVVDRSYSMIVEEDRWSPIEQTLSNVTRNLGGNVHFGLVLFPSPNPDLHSSEAERACAEGEVNVAPGPDTAADINGWLMNEPPQPGLATPTYSALDAAGRSLLQAPSGNDYILLATDGGPGCNFDLNPDFCPCLNHSCILGLPEMCLDDHRTVNKVSDLAAAGIRTIVLGISSEGFMPESRAVLDRMAVAGQTDLNGHHYEVNHATDLEQSLTAAAGQLVPCTYHLGELALHADDLVITVDGDPITRDLNHQNGWDVAGASVEFFGAACESLRDGSAHEISADCL